jgi:hypothetical protein
MDQPCLTCHGRGTVIHEGTFGRLGICPTCQGTSVATAGELLSRVPLWIIAAMALIGAALEVPGPSHDYWSSTPASGWSTRPGRAEAAPWPGDHSRSAANARPPTIAP